MRYIVLVLLNTPIIILALINTVTQYKLKRVAKRKFFHQIIMWGILFVLLILSFPMYNLFFNKAPLDSSELSIFDILQTTGIILLLYIANSQRIHIEQSDHRLRKLHQELSILLSKK